MGKPKSPTRRRWNAEELATLQWSWAEVPVAKIAKKLGRTEIAILKKADELSLGGIRRGGKTIAQISRETGYGVAVIKRVARNLGLKLRRHFRGGHGGKPRDHRIQQEQEEKIVAYLREYGKGKVFSHEGFRSPRGMWGVGRKPSACSRCEKSDKPHYATGKCRLCYDIEWREAHREPTTVAA